MSKPYDYEGDSFDFDDFCLANSDGNVNNIDEERLHELEDYYYTKMEEMREEMIEEELNYPW